MLRITLIVLLSFCATQAWSESETAKDLLEVAQKQQVYKNSTPHRNCPDYIKLDLIEDSSYNTEGQHLVSLDGMNKDGSYDSFTFEGNYFPILKNLNANHTKTYDRDLQYILGVSYTSSFQSESNGVLTNIYSAKILSFVMSGTTYYKLSYNSLEETVLYFFKGNGVEDVSCLYMKSSLE